MYPTVEFFEDIIPFFNQFLNKWIFHGFFCLFVCLFFSGVIAILGEVEANRYYLWEEAVISKQLQYMRLVTFATIIVGGLTFWRRQVNY